MATQKQIDWADDIIATWKPHWDSAVAEHFDTIKKGVEGAAQKAADRGYSEARTEKMIARYQAKVDAIIEADKIMQSDIDPITVIENRGVFQFPDLAQGLSTPDNLASDAQRIVSTVG